MDASRPTLPAYRYYDGQAVSLVAWCVYCVQWHWHGAGKAPGAGDGPRAAHCVNPKSPYRVGGYVLQEMGPMTKRAMQEHARAQRRRGRTQA